MEGASFWLDKLCRKRLFRWAASQSKYLWVELVVFLYGVGARLDEKVLPDGLFGGQGGVGRQALGVHDLIMLINQYTTNLNS